METAGAILGSVMIAYIALASAQLFKQQRSSRLKSELTLELLRQQLRAASILCEQREQDQLCWNGYRKFVVRRKVDEASGVCLCYLAPHDGKPLPRFRPGQFLTFRLSIPGFDKPVVRCYSISSTPNSEFYRITIKRVPDGTVSNFFHDHVDEGTILDVQTPRGKFAVDPTLQNPVVLIAGGVGVTPFVSMAGAIASEKSGREVVLVHASRNGHDHILCDHLRNVAAENENIRLHNFYSRPDAADRIEVDFDIEGRISIDAIKSLLLANNYDFYLCGPSSAHSVGTQRSIADKKPSAKSKQPAAAAVKAKVTFSKSGQTEDWDDSNIDILSLAEQKGIRIEAGCAAGSCGTCQTAVRSGKVTYLDRVLRGWLENSAAALVADAANVEKSLALRRMFRILENPTASGSNATKGPVASGRCLACHTADRDTADGSLRIHWHAFRPAAGHGLTKFAHDPHVTTLQQEECTDCHKVDPKAAFPLQFYRGEFFTRESQQQTLRLNTDANSARTSGFSQMKKTICATCHKPAAVGGACLQCHKYHGGKLIDHAAMHAHP